MLKKLFKHEWKDCWRLIGLLNIIVVGLTLIGSICFGNQTWSDTNQNDLLGLFLVFYMLFYIASIIALSVVVTLYFYYRFYKNLYTDQGYLMHTLPVNEHQLIWSKMFVAAIWQFISTIVMAISITTLVISMMSSNEKQNFFASIAEAFKGFEFDFRMIIVGILGLIGLAVAFAMSVFMGYAAISIGQQFKKQKILGAIGVYVGFYMLIQIISSIGTWTMNRLTINTQINIEGYSAAIIVMLIYIIFYGAVATAYYFITANAMKNKLNLE